MRILKNKFIHPSCYLLVLWFLINGRILEFLNFALALGFHEYGHYYVSKKRGYVLNKFYIAPYGACLNYREKQFERRDEFWIAISGPLTNLSLCFLFAALWWVFPETYCFSFPFVRENFLLATFNLLPVYPLDGGRVLVALLSQIKDRTFAVKVSMVLSVCFGTLFFILFAISWFYNFNPTFALAGVFMFLGLLSSEKGAVYQNSFLLKKKITPFSKSRHLLVESNLRFKDLLKKIDSDCYTVFEILSPKGRIFYLSETQVVALSIRLGAEQEISKLLEK